MSSTTSTGSALQVIGSGSALQAHVGADLENYVPATLENTLWGELPCQDDAPVMTVTPGSTVVFDTISHEGIMADQGRDPVRFFGEFGVSVGDVLQDAIEIAANGEHLPANGPHVVTGPVHVAGAQPGDLLVIDILSLTPRVGYGLVSSRHGKGLLPHRFPSSGAVYSAFCPVTDGVASLPLSHAAGADRVHFGLAPFLGIMGVATAGPMRLNSTPPGLYGGNLDLALLVAGTTLYLPVQTPGAGFYVGDPHFAQGNGEIALTALEAPLRAELRLSVLPNAAATSLYGAVRGPFARTADFLVPTGLDVDLDLAVAKCAENALQLLDAGYGMQPELAYAYLSAACDFQISQVVDVVKGAHALIRLADFASVGRC